MELREPRKKKSIRLEPKSSLPLVFGSKGELTKFHANLTALGSCVADPTEMQIIYKMGYFGKGSLSNNSPNFGKAHHSAPPVIRKRQWERRQGWIEEVQKLNVETLYDGERIENDLLKREESQVEEKDTTENNTLIENKSDHEAVNNSCELMTTKFLVDKEQRTSEIEIMDNTGNCRNHETSMEIDEVVLDSTEDEDISDTSGDNYQSNIDKSDLFDKNEDLIISNEYSRDDSEVQGKVLVLPDSDSDDENYLLNIKPEVKDETFPVREALHLTSEETFFLMYGLGCLRVIDFDGKFLSIEQTWKYFCKEQKYFLQKYVTYHYFRSKGWVVKPGLKYGGDFILYKEGPPFYHSSYIVVIDVLDAVTLKRIDNKAMRNMTWNNFIGLERLAETVRKEILFAQVLWPDSVPIDTNPASPDVLSQFTVREILWRRWKLNINTFSASVEDDCSNDDEDDSL